MRTVSHRDIDGATAADMDSVAIICDGGNTLAIEPTYEAAILDARENGMGIVDDIDCGNNEPEYGSVYAAIVGA